MKPKTFAALLAILLLIWISIPRYKPNPFPVKSIIDYENGINVHYPITGDNKLDDRIKKFVDDTIENFSKSRPNTSILHMDFGCYSSVFTAIRFKITIEKEEAARNQHTKKTWHKNFFTFVSTPIFPTMANTTYDGEGNAAKKPKDGKKLVAITFDDGPSEHTDKIVDILNQHNAKATFFVLGTQVEGNRETLQKVYASGHEIGNHTFGHKKLTALSDKEIEEEIEKTQEAVKSVIGVYPSFLRPTYGAFNTNVRNASNMPLIMWNKDTMDWKSKNPDYIFKQATDNLKDGDIILFHDIYPTTVTAIEKFIPYLIENGYQPVTVSQLFEAKGITLENGKAYFSSKQIT